MDVRMAAEALGVSPDRIRQLIGSGELAAERVGRFWVLDRASVRRRARSDPSDGRPYGQRQVWQMAALAEVDREAEGAADGEPLVDPKERWRLHRYLVDLADEDDAAVVAWRLRRRADGVVERYAHPSVLNKLARDLRVLVSGSHSVAARGADLVPDDHVDAYVDRGDFADISAEYGLIEADGRPNVRLRVAMEPSGWRDLVALAAHGGQRVAPLLIAIADLSEREDARASLAANDLWSMLRARLRELGT